MIVEAELCAAVSEILERLGFDDFTIRINHREILFALLRSSGVPEEKHFDALIALDKIDKIGRIGVEKELAERGISDTANKRLITAMEFFIKDISVKSLTGKEKLEVLELLKLDNKVESEKYETLESLRSSFKKDGKSKEETIETVVKEITNLIATGTAFKEISSLLNNDEKGLVAKSQLEKIWTLSMLRYSGLRIKFDPSLARGLSYYTGAIFEINVPDLTGSLGGGGRYDGLIGMFGKEQIPACGFSLGLERILVVMEERGMFPKELSDSPADVLVTVWNEDAIGESLKLADELRKENLRVLVYPEADKLGKQFKYADSLRIQKAIILRDEEIAENKVKIKNLVTSEETIISREEVLTKIKQ
jgi:histidyl-tRNA synthetase